MWNLPRSGIKPVSPALAGEFFITEPPEKPCQFLLILTHSNTTLTSLSKEENVKKKNLHLDQKTDENVKPHSSNQEKKWQMIRSQSSTLF